MLLFSKVVSPWGNSFSSQKSKQNSDEFGKWDAHGVTALLDLPGSFFFFSCIVKLKWYLTQEICTPYIFTWVKPPPTVNSSCTFFLVFLYHWWAWRTLLHRANIIHSYKFHIPATLWKYFSNPFLTSCEFYSFPLPYICTFYLHGCFRVMVERVALMYIPSIRFELDFYRILCRIFCFGEILPVVRDFCSLSPVSYSFFFWVAAMSWGATEENDNFLHIHLDAVNNTQTRNAQRWSSIHTFKLCSSHFSLDNIAPCRICYDCQKLVFWLWDCFCLLYLPLHYNNLQHSYHRLCWERNKYYFVLELFVSTLMYQSIRVQYIY